VPFTLCSVRKTRERIFVSPDPFQRNQIGVELREVFLRFEQKFADHVVHGYPA